MWNISLTSSLLEAPYSSSSRSISSASRSGTDTLKTLVLLATAYLLLQYYLDNTAEVKSLYMQAGRSRGTSYEPFAAHLRAVGHAGEDVLMSKLRVLFQYLLNGHSCGELVQY